MNLKCCGHLGDCMWTLQLMRKTPGEHMLFCDPAYRPALETLVAGTPIRIGAYKEADGARESWIANGQFAGDGISFAQQEDILRFVRMYHNRLAEALEEERVLETPRDMLCDWPSIEQANIQTNFDILFINARPGSHQFPAYDKAKLDRLASLLAERGHSIICTNETPDVFWADFTLPEIGALSMRCKLIVAVATGPMWPTWNVWNIGLPRIIMLDPQYLDYDTANVHHAKDVRQAEEQIRNLGWL